MPKNRYARPSPALFERAMHTVSRTQLRRWRQAIYGASSFDHPVRTHKQRLRYGQAEHLRGFQVDHQLELGRLLDRQVAWFRALENAIDVMGRPTKPPFGVVTVTEQRPGLGAHVNGRTN